jgi:hypothetical protein
VPATGSTQEDLPFRREDITVTRLPFQPLTTRGCAEWGAVLGDEVLATAILDRLLHHCDVININGPSYRLKDRLTLVSGGDNLQ